MEIITTQKYLRISPRKLMPIATLAKKMRPGQAVEVLPLLSKKGAPILAKAVLNAIAIAKEKGISVDELSFKEIQVNEGPRLKRGMPVSRGMWHPIKKRMSHIRVVLITKEKKTPVKEEEKVVEKQSEEKVKAKAARKEKK